MKNETLKRILSSLILIPIVFFFIIKGSLFFIFFLGVFLLFASYEWIKMSKNQFKFIGILYLLFSSYSALILRDRGVDLLFFVILICIFTDIGGYIFGKVLKGPKLTKLSPNKTFAGMFGSYMFCFLLYIICLNFNIIDKNYQLNALIFIFLISSVSQLGDILISYFKRLSNIKDTGKIIPGHGGILDRIDGILLGIPVGLVYVLILVFTG